MTVPLTTPGVLGRIRARITKAPPTNERSITRRSAHRSLLATAVTAVTLLGLSVPTASAGSPEEIRTSGAWAKFDDLGEILMVGDIAEGRKGARAYLHWAGGNSASVYVGGYAEPLDTKDLSIPEGTKVTLTVCYTKRKLDVQCSDFQWAEA